LLVPFDIFSTRRDIRNWPVVADQITIAAPQIVTDARSQAGRERRKITRMLTIQRSHNFPA
jgi:hypothetical protein